MLYKISLKSMLFGALVLVCTNNVLATVTSKIEKLSEYDALEVLPEAMQGSIQTFKGKPIVVKLDDTDNGLFLNSTILINFNIRLIVLFPIHLLHPLDCNYINTQYLLIQYLYIVKMLNDNE